MLEGSMMVARALVLLLLLGSLGELGTEAQNTLDKREVDILKKAASKLNVTFWNFDVDPCSDTGAGQWFVNTSDNLFMRQVTCGNCNSSTNVCHIVSIRLKSQNLSGILPEDFASLTSLTEIDLTWNYLGGSIPSAWGSLSLVRLSLLGNRLTGEIPEDIGNIKNLGFLILENNLFQGRVPRALGKLSNLTRLLLSANNFTGVLPEELGKLKSLEDFRIDGNAITGNIPDFIGNWTRLKRLDMQGTALEGPFPNSFSVLENLTELRVTDFKGNGFFPPLQRNMKLLYLILRNCSISGQIPDFIRNMSNLNRLDLSFNNFTGEIPSSLEKISKNLNYLFLTNNNLSGPIPKWILESKQNVDISYNSFNGSAPSTCRHGFVNSVASFPSSENNLKPSCLRKNLPCSKKPMNYELFINCGGKSVTVDDKYYEGNNGGSGQTATYFFTANDERWAFSSTGYFVGNNKAPYVTGNLSTLHMINPAPYYMSARLSPMSLKYYGLCLQKGIYNVSLYFAEIMLTDDQTFSSVGRRIFDVSIQGNKVLEDFNIVEAANGTGIGIVKSFDIAVDDGTVEIHFQWLGKGTNAIPYRGMYGPLISAISVTPNFPPDLSEESKPSTGAIFKPSTGAIFKPSTGAIIGIVIGCFLFVLVILLAVLFYLRKKNKEKIELDGLDLHTGLFSLREIKSATEDFDPKNKIGEGGFGPVYKGVLRDGSSIAVKKLSAKSKQGNREFVNEIGMITALHHPNLVKLYGCCIEGKQLFLVYEYLENNSLARALFGMKLNLDWQTRCKICIGIARGLAYLHEESALKIVHRDIKATNILLDKDLNAKISDFGLAKLDEDENTHISTRIAGTLGYMSPEYAMRGYLTDKADVYSFGVVVLELVSGKSNSNYKTLDDFVYLLDWAYVLQEKGNLLELVDPCLGSNYSKKEVQEMLDLALLCTCPSPSLRPKMSTVVGMLQGQITMTAPPTSNNNDSAISDVVSPKAFQTLSKDCQVMGISTDAPCSKTSVNATSSEEENVLLGN